MTLERLGGEPPCFAHLFTPPVLDAGTAVGLLTELADAVVIGDRNGRIAFWNFASERLFGWPADDVLDRMLDVIIPEQHRGSFWQGYRKILAAESTRFSTQLLEVPALHRDGSRLSVSATLTFVRDAGDVMGIAAVVREENERRQERRRLQHRVPLLAPQSSVLAL